MKEIIEEVFNQVMDEACTNPLHRFSELLLERVQKTDIFIHEEIERLKAEIKRANELAEYRLKLLMQMPEPEQEPVATRNSFSGIIEVEWGKSVPIGTKLYTAPPSKPWVSLTDEEIENISNQIERSDFFDCVIPFARAIEAKLKEKNT